MREPAGPGMITEKKSALRLPQYSIS